MGDSACPGEATILFDAGTTFFRAMKKSFAFILIVATSPYLHKSEDSIDVESTAQLQYIKI